MWPSMTTTGRSSKETAVAIEPLGPWHVSMDPFPFGGTEATFTLDRRVLAKNSWTSDTDGKGWLELVFLEV